MAPKSAWLKHSYFQKSVVVIILLLYCPFPWVHMCFCVSVYTCVLPLGPFLLMLPVGRSSESLRGVGGWHCSPCGVLQTKPFCSPLLCALCDFSFYWVETHGRRQWEHGGKNMWTTGFRGNNSGQPVESSRTFLHCLRVHGWPEQL